MNRTAILLRLKAGSIHLGISVAIALAAMAVIFLVWYPTPFAEAQGVSRLVLVLIGVDVVIGPLITTIIYDTRKKWLPLDLGVIAALQTVALLYGLQAIYGGRPAYLVFNVDRFDVVALKEIDPESLSRAGKQLGPRWNGPRTLAARLPDDPVARSEMMFSSINGGADLPQLPEYFVPLDDERETMLKRLRPLNELRKLNELDEQAWGDLLRAFGKTEASLGYLPMVANVKDGAVVLDARSGEILGIRMLTPHFESAPAQPNTPPTPAPTVPSDAPSPISAPEHPLS